MAGWYWWRRDQHALPGVAIVCSDLSGYYMSRTGHNSTFDHVDDVIGEWLGPLSPDDKAQGRVAGLREAHVFAMEVGAFYTAHRIGALIDKAQQAQDEKGVGE